jgi:hypothetical protein
MVRGLIFILLGLISIGWTGEIISKKVSGEIPLDPFDPLWKTAPSVEVPLAGQTVTKPMELGLPVSSLKVKSLNNGREIAFLLVWEDKTKDSFHLINRFSDAVAVQIPYQPTDQVPVTMGANKQRVLILHWTAFRQENLEGGYSDVSKIHPNYAYDWYPHAKPPYLYPKDWANQYALAYIGGEKVFRKNTFKTPVREVVAEGFGSSTWKDVQSAQGKGIYRNGKWYVVIKREFVVENTSNPSWGPGKTTYATFAVWDGSSGHRGARKVLSYQWFKLKIER